MNPATEILFRIVAPLAGKAVGAGLLSQPIDLRQFYEFSLRDPKSWKKGDSTKGIYTTGVFYCNVPVMYVSENDKICAATGWHVSHENKCMRHFSESFTRKLTEYDEEYPNHQFEKMIKVYSRYLDAHGSAPDETLRLLSGEIYSKITNSIAGRVPIERVLISSKTVIIDKGNFVKTPFLQKWENKFSDHKGGKSDYPRGR